MIQSAGSAKALCKILRSEMRAQAYTIKSFAKELGVSEPTLKRWLNGGGLSLDRWAQLLKALGISLADVAASMRDSGDELFEYSERQERELAKTAGLLAFFQCMLIGKTPPQIARQFKLDDRSLAFYLQRLDRIGLIDWQREFAARLKRRGEPKWRKNGDLAKLFRERIFRELLVDKREKFRMAIYNLTNGDAEKFSAQLEELLVHARRAEQRSKINQETTYSYGFAFALDRYAPDFLYHVPARK